MRPEPEMRAILSGNYSTGDAKRVPDEDTLGTGQDAYYVRDLNLQEDFSSVHPEQDEPEDQHDRKAVEHGLKSRRC